MKTIKKVAAYALRALHYVLVKLAAGATYLADLVADQLPEDV